MPTWFKYSLTVLFLSACQAPPQAVLSPTRQTASLQRLSVPRPQYLLTAKDAFTLADQKARAWSQAAALTHVLGHQITSQGLPHASYGSWTFSFIDYDHPEQGFQVVVAAAQPPVTRILPASQLPIQEPLEERAWELDSNTLIPRLRQLLPSLDLPLKDVELTSREHRLIWALPSQQFDLDAMTGQPFQIY